MYQMFQGRVGAAFFIHFVVVVGYSLNNNNKKKHTYTHNSNVTLFETE